jgi:hypothetical protein
VPRRFEPVVVAAALHDEVRDDAMEHRPVVASVPHVAQEILGRERCADGVQLHDEVAGRRLEPHARRERRGSLRQCGGRNEEGEKDRDRARHVCHLAAILAYAA